MIYCLRTGGVVHLGISDQSSIFCLQFSTKRKNYLKSNINDYFHDLSQIPRESVALHDHPNTCYRVWKSYFLQAVDRHAPLKPPRVRANSLSWGAPNIKNWCKQKNFIKWRLLNVISACSKQGTKKLGIKSIQKYGSLIKISSVRKSKIVFWLKSQNKAGS